MTKVGHSPASYITTEDVVIENILIANKISSQINLCQNAYLNLRLP